MEERKTTIFDYLIHVLVIFGFTMIVMMCFTVWFGESASEISTMYGLGAQGIPVEIMLQFLGVSILTTFFRYLFFSNWLIKNMAEVVRTILMVCSIIAVITVFIVIFHWFPVDMWQPWVMFVICFVICFGASVTLTLLKTRLENKRLEEGLERMKRQWKEQDEDES